MKRDNKKIEQEIHNFSYESVRMLADDMEISDEEKQRIYQKTLKRTGVKPDELRVEGVIPPTGRKHLLYKKPIVVAAAVMLAMSIGVGSIVGAGSVTKSFGQFFHTLSQDEFDRIVFDINQSQTDNGVTVTLTQGMCDGTGLYIIERVDFDPSVITLTDDMFVQTKGNYNAPFFSVDTVSHEVTDASGISRGFSKLLEHDTHSMTFMCTYGDGIVSDYYRNNTHWVLKVSGVENLAGQNDQTYACSFQFEFDATLCDPTVYNLPGNIFSYPDDLGNTDDPDVYINPWYMLIMPGRQLRTELKSDMPALAITMKSGKVYTDKDGIRVGGNPFETQDLLGKDFELYSGVYCTFDEEIDVTNIESISLYGYELIKAPVPEVKPLEILPSEKEEHSATYPVTVPKDEKTVQVTEFKAYSDPKKGFVEEEIPAGSVRYRVKNINVYDNLYAAGASRKDILKLAIEDGKFLYYDDKGVLYGKGFSDACNIKSGSMNDGFYLVEYEIEMTNVDASLSTFYENFFHARVYCNYSYFNYSENCYVTDTTYLVPTAYILENDLVSAGRNDTFTLEKGQTRTLHVGFIVHDNHRGSLSQLGLNVGTGLQDKPDYVNITKAVEHLKKSK